VYYVTDGYSALPITVVGNYKFAQDGDGGFLTNGIGCYAPDYKVNDVVLSRVDNVIKNTLTALEKKGTPYVGIIGIDCTLTGDDKFYINEFKPFMQDFDCAAVLNTVGDDLIKLFNPCVEGYFSDEYEKISDSDISSVSAVVTSRQPSKVIGGLDLIDDSDNIDFVNVKQTNDDKYLTVTGESFVLTRSASTLTRARNYLYDDLSVINFAGMKYRKDICS
jgi:phosphoribosylamine-glycine ligase